MAGLVSGEGWGADTRISMPAPKEGEALIQMDEVWCFTAQGLRHNLTQAERDEYLFPTFVPEGWRI